MRKIKIELKKKYSSEIFRQIQIFAIAVCLHEAFEEGEKNK